jgi:iron(III) transport system permease protein
VAPNGLTRPAAAFTGLGYAVPGTILAIGLLIPLAAFDNAVDSFFRAWFGVSTGLLLTGSVAALVLAYVIRFMAIAFGTIEAGLTRISPNLDAAARSLGQTAIGTLKKVHLPMLRAPVGAALLLVFVDAMKELPATLLLRPFGFDTLATRVYSFAALEQFEQGALSATMIVVAGLVPLILLARRIGK